MQGNGSECLRLACCLATESGIRVAAPIHDAVLAEASLSDLPDVISATKNAMAKASRIVLGDLELRTEVKTIRFPERFRDPRGEAMWSAVWDLLPAGG